MSKVNNNIQDFINESLKDNNSTFKTIELIENGVLSPFEVLETLKQNIL